MERCGFTNSQTSLIEAFNHFKDGDNSAAIHSAHKALESTVDYLLDMHKVSVTKDKMPVKIKALVDHVAFPSEYESSLTSLVNVLQTTGIIRNRNGGHGYSREVVVEDCFVQFAIDSTASAILFMVRLLDEGRIHSN